MPPGLLLVVIQGCQQLLCLPDAEVADVDVIGEVLRLPPASGSLWGCLPHPALAEGATYARLRAWRLYPRSPGSLHSTDRQGWNRARFLYLGFRGVRGRVRGPDSLKGLLLTCSLLEVSAPGSGRPSS